ncbi:MAG: hypothetical protein KAH20_03670 [Methylococcales bacterium]|nr:hypothetical protein [Methylococcales bacterium]
MLIPDTTLSVNSPSKLHKKIKTLCFSKDLLNYVEKLAILLGKDKTLLISSDESATSSSSIKPDQSKISDIDLF